MHSFGGRGGLDFSAPVCHFVKRAGISFELGCYLSSPLGHLLSRLNECHPRALKCRRAASFMCTVPQCLSGLLTAALGRKHFTEELKLQRDTAGQWGVRAAVPPAPPGPSPALHVQSLTQPHHARGDWIPISILGFEEQARRSRPGAIGSGCCFQPGQTPRGEPGCHKASERQSPV